MAFTLLTDELWNVVEPLLPRERPKPLGGRPRVSDRQCLTGIIFLLRTGLPWRFIPQELGCGSGVTCWRRLRDWTQAGVWPRLLAKMVETLGRQGKIDASLAVMDSASFRALFGGITPDRTRRTEPRKAANAMCSATRTVRPSSCRRPPPM
jgi:transposase